MRTNYRGFTIELKSDGEWSAEISNAATGKHWSQRLNTPIAEGSGACLKRAQNLVDAFLALHGAR
jgi:hypothetical protein